MALIRPRLNDFHDLPFTQGEVDFAIPFLNEDIPLFVDPFLLYKSPSQQDQALHTSLISSFNHFGNLYKDGNEDEAIDSIIKISECKEVGLGTSQNKKGQKIGSDKAQEILSLFDSIPQIEYSGFNHIETIQLLINQISKDRISDFTCSLIKSFLIDFTIDQCKRLNIPTFESCELDIFNYQKKKFLREELTLPINPENQEPIIFVPKRWLRYLPWINYDDYFSKSFTTDEQIEKGLTDKVEVLNYNRRNYGLIQEYISHKERKQDHCKNDPLFKPIPIYSAKRKLNAIDKLPTGKKNRADKKYENYIGQLMASLLYPHLDFASEQERTISGVHIKDLIFYNNRSLDFLEDIHDDYDSRQIVMELKNVETLKTKHIDQLNRYLNEPFGRFGIIITRNRMPKSVFKNTVDLWAGQRRCIISITDQDLSLMVNVFESKQRLPIEVIKKSYIKFIRACPS